MKRLALLVVSVVLAILLTGCNSGSNTVSRMIYADPDSTWAAVKKVIASRQSVMPATIDEKNRVITIKNAFGDIQSSVGEHGTKLSTVQSYNAVISLTASTANGSNGTQKVEYTVINMKVSRLRPQVSSPTEQPTALDDNQSSYGFTITSSTDIQDSFIGEVQKELDAMKRQQAVIKVVR